MSSADGWMKKVEKKDRARDVLAFSGAVYERRRRTSPWSIASTKPSAEGQSRFVRVDLAVAKWSADRDGWPQRRVEGQASVCKTTYSGWPLITSQLV